MRALNSSGVLDETNEEVTIPDLNSPGEEWILQGFTISKVSGVKLNSMKRRKMRT